MLVYAENENHVLEQVGICEQPGVERTLFMDAQKMAEGNENYLLTNVCGADLSGTSVVDANIKKMEDGRWRARILFHNPGDVVNNKPQYTDVDFESYAVYANEKLELAFLGPDQKFEIRYEKDVFERAKVDNGIVDLMTQSVCKGEMELGKVMAVTVLLKEKVSGRCVFADLAFLFAAGDDLKMWKETMKEIVTVMTGKKIEVKRVTAEVVAVEDGVASPPGR